MRQIRKTSNEKIIAALKGLSFRKRLKFAILILFYNKIK